MEDARQGVRLLPSIYAGSIRDSATRPGDAFKPALAGGGTAARESNQSSFPRGRRA